MKKKMILAMLTMSMILSAGMSVCAEEADQTGENTLGTEFSYEIKNDPTYTITIPSSVAISENGTKVEIEAKNVANLDGKKVSVTIAGTDYFQNQMVLSGKSEDGKNSVMRYQIITEDGTVIETTGTKNQANGKELASFTENGVVDYTVKPVVLPSTLKSVNHTGSMTYGISLVDAE